MARDLAEVLRFGRYEPLFRIGIGGMAEVYAARIVGEGGFRKHVAVKRMLPHLTGDKKFVDMFLDEARLAANISSPHVVQTLDLGRAEDDSLYIVMELIVGVTLSQVMTHLAEHGTPIEPTIGLELIAQAAQGLDDAHEAKAPSGEPMHLVHRDVSPQNILVGMDGRARMTDFGIAHALYLRRTHTRMGEKKGKFSYFSPEQATDAPLDRRTDVFALGVVAWEVLAGKRLFKGKPHESLHMVQHKEIPELQTLRPDLTEQVSRVVAQALERDPDQRWATAGQLAAALKRASLTYGDTPSPRVIGRFAEEVGGSPLARVQRTIAAADSHSGSGTAVLPGPGGGTLVLPGAEDSAEELDPDLTWVPGQGATSLLTGAMTFTGEIASEPTVLLPGAADVHDAATQTLQMPPAESSESLEQAGTVQWLAGHTRPRRVVDAAPSRRRGRLLLIVAVLLLVGGTAFAVALAVTLADDELPAESVVSTPGPSVRGSTEEPAESPSPGGGPGLVEPSSEGVDREPSTMVEAAGPADPQAAEAGDEAGPAVSEAELRETRRLQRLRERRRRERERRLRGMMATGTTTPAMHGVLPSMLEEW